jgi:cellulose synthase/poly-beta-1,6-N-acetylglucosamine synthase-like glycosyltransferase
MEISIIISFLSKFIIFVSLYFAIFWFLLLLNVDKKIRIIRKYPSVTLLIPAYNEEKGIEKTIKSCMNTKYLGKLEIIVINDASNDNTIKIAKKYKDKIIIIDKKVNQGKAAAINDGLNKASGKIIGIVDADSEISSQAVKNCVANFGSYDNQKVGAVISKMKPANENSNILERIQLIEYMLVSLIRYFFSYSRLLHTTPGVLSMYDAKALNEIGGFDPKNLTEDFEVAVRLRKKGYLIGYSYDSPVYTNTPSDFKTFLKQRIRWSRGFIQTHKKHKDIFFNKKYGLFGLYQFPMNVIGPIIFFLAIFTISYNIYRKLYEILFKLIFTPDLLELFVFDSLKDFLLTSNPKIDLPIIISFLLVLLVYYGIIKFYDYNFFKKSLIKKILAFVIYIMLYNYIYIYVWIISIIKEIKTEKYD